MKWIRAAAALVVLATLVITVRGWWTQYKTAPPATGGVTATSEATATPGAAEPVEAPPQEPAPPEEAPAEEQVLEVLTDGLNFRVDPDATAKAIRGLQKGETVTVLNKNGGWYQVRTEQGDTGWITDNPSYTRTKKK